jgi:uncharacterized protein (TIGR04255 family)
MSAYEPINPDHAIAAAGFALNFNRPLNEGEIGKAKQIEPAVKDFLPGTSSFGGSLPGFAVPAVSLLGLQFPSLPTGIIFQRVNPDATPAWTLTAQQNFITAQCMAYTRWADVWGRIRAWLSQLYGLVKSSDLLLSSISLQYKDQFSAAKPLDGDILEKLFKTDTPYLPPRTFQNQELWHVHQGWYLPATQPIVGRKLNVLNIGTQDSGASIVLTIDHLFRYETDDGDPPLFTNRDGSALIDIVMEDLHAQNKSLLRHLLSAQMARRIRLDG